MSSAIILSITYEPLNQSCEAGKVVGYLCGQIMFFLLACCTLSNNGQGVFYFNNPPSTGITQFFVLRDLCD